MTLANRIEPYRARLRLQARRLRSKWLKLSPYRRTAIITTAVVLVCLLIFALPDSTACTTQADATDRLADVMQDLQGQASSGTLNLDELAHRVTEINAAATTLTRSGDAQAYCNALETARARPRR